MARNINGIKTEIAREFMRNEYAAELYGFAPGSEFGDIFGAASVENILLYVWAVCAWTVEQLVSRHKEEVAAELEELMAHRPKWYLSLIHIYLSMGVQPNASFMSLNRTLE